VTTEDADDRVRELAKTAGLLVGWSTGAAVVAAERAVSAAYRPHGAGDACVVVIAPDSGDRYLSERGRLVGETR
jgi:cysteine synthase